MSFSSSPNSQYFFVRDWSLGKQDKLMQRALIWLNLNGCQAKCIFTPFLSLHRTARQPYRLSHITALPINLSYSPKDQSLKFSQKNIENWQSWKMTFCFVFLFLVIGVFKICFLFFRNENHHGFHMRQRLFLHYGWFLQNLEEGFIRTNMHTNVHFAGNNLFLNEGQEQGHIVTKVG